MMDGWKRLRIDIIFFFLAVDIFCSCFSLLPPPCPRCLRSPSFPSYFSLRFLVIFFSSWICTKRYIPLLFFRSHITKRTHTIFVTISPPTILILVIKPILEKKKLLPTIIVSSVLRSLMFFLKKKENTHFHHWQLTSKTKELAWRKQQVFRPFSPCHPVGLDMLDIRKWGPLPLHYKGLQ